MIAGYTLLLLIGLQLSPCVKEHLSAFVTLVAHFFHYLTSLFAFFYALGT